MDFKEALDTVQHSSAWSALREQGNEEPTYSLLMKLYDQQRGTVQTDGKSKTTPPQVRNQAGRPAQYALVQLTSTVNHETTHRKVKQSQLRSQPCRARPRREPFLRFADDNLLLSSSFKYTTTMPDDLTTATPAHGLQLQHTKNTNRLQHDTTKQKNNTVAAQGMNFQTLPARILRPTHHIQRKRSPNHRIIARGPHS